MLVKCRTFIEIHTNIARSKPTLRARWNRIGRTAVSGGIGYATIRTDALITTIGIGASCWWLAIMLVNCRTFIEIHAGSAHIKIARTTACWNIAFDGYEKQIYYIIDRKFICT